MAHDLSEICAKLTLNEEDYIVDLGNVDLGETEDRVSLIIVGKLLTERSFNIEAFKTQ